MALSRVCWARAALWGSAVTPGPYVTRKLQLARPRAGLAWGAPRWGTWEKGKRFWCSGPSSLSTLFAWLFLILSVTRPSPGFLFWSEFAPRSLLVIWLPDPLQLSGLHIVRIPHVFRALSASLFLLKLYGCLSGSHLSGLSLLFKWSLRPCAPCRLIPTPNVPSRLIFHLPDLFFFSDRLSLPEPKIFLGFQKFQALAYIPWDLVFYISVNGLQDWCPDSLFDLPCRSSNLHLSPKADVKSLISYVVTKTKVINGKYHRFLGRHFPRFYVLYTIFMKGKAKTEIPWISSWAMSKS